MTRAAVRTVGWTLAFIIVGLVGWALDWVRLELLLIAFIPAWSVGAAFFAWESLAWRWRKQAPSDSPVRGAPTLLGVGVEPKPSAWANGGPASDEASDAPDAPSPLGDEPPEAPKPKEDAGSSLWRAWRTVVAAGRTAAAVVHANGTVEVASARLADMLGAGVDDLQGRTLAELFDEQDRAMVLAKATMGDRARTLTFEARLDIPDVVRWAYVELTPITGLDGRVAALAARFSDVTAHHLRDRELRREREVFESLVANLPTPVYWKDATGVYLGCNEAFAALVGLSDPSEAPGKTDADLGWPASQAARLASVDREAAERLGGGHAGIAEPVEQEFDFGDGVPRTMLVSRMRIDSPRPGVLVSMQEITDRVTAEAALRETQDRYEAIFQSSPAPLLLIAEGGRILDANEAATGLYGRDADELRTMTTADLLAPGATVPPVDVEGDRAGALVSRRYETRHATVTGRPRPVEVSIEPLDVGGRRLELHCVTDLLEREMSETALRFRIRFESVISRVLARFMDASFDALDVAIRETLGDVATFLGAERAYACVLASDGDASLCDEGYEWRAGGVGPRLHVGAPRTGAGDWWVGQIRERRTVRVTSLADIPAEGERERRELWRHGVQSVLAAPMVIEGRVVGFLGVDALSSRRVWTDDDEKLVEGVAVIVASGLRRRRQEDDMRRATETERMLLRELDHRVKNNLSSLLSLISLSREQATDTDALAASISSRVEAMATVHRLFSEQHYAPVALGDLITALTPSSSPGEVTAEGSEVRCVSRQLVAMGMVLQELMTNSLKYGALGSPGGRVDVRWTSEPVDGRDAVRVRISWREQGGPRIESPVRPGVGTGLIEGFVRHELRGRIELRFEEDGADHVLEAVLEDGADD